MWRWRRVAVARVFALVVRCRVMMLLLNSRVGKNRDTSGSPRRQPGQAVPPTTKRSSLARKLSRYGKPMTYTDLLGAVSVQFLAWLLLHLYSELGTLTIKLYRQRTFILLFPIVAAFQLGIKLKTLSISALIMLSLTIGCCLKGLVAINSNSVAFPVVSITNRTKYFVVSLAEFRIS